MLSLLQIPTGPQREPQTMANLCLVLTPSQLLSKPQACQRGRGRGRERGNKNDSLLGFFQSNKCKHGMILML